MSDDAGCSGEERMRRNAGGRGNIAVSAATLHLRGSRRQQRCGCCQAVRGSCIPQLGNDFQWFDGNFCLIAMASDIMSDCFYHRGMPKIRRSPVTSTFACLIHSLRSLRWSFWAGRVNAARAPTVAAGECSTAVQSALLLSHAIVCV